MKKYICLVLAFIPFSVFAANDNTSPSSGEDHILFLEIVFTPIDAAKGKIPLEQYLRDLNTVGNILLAQVQNQNIFGRQTLDRGILNLRIFPKAHSRTDTPIAVVVNPSLLHAEKDLGKVYLRVHISLERVPVDEGKLAFMTSAENYRNVDAISKAVREIQNLGIFDAQPRVSARIGRKELVRSGHYRQLNYSATTEWNAWSEVFVGSPTGNSNLINPELLQTLNAKFNNELKIPTQALICMKLY